MAVVVHHQRIADLLGLDGLAWPSEKTDYAAALPFEVAGMLRSRANTIEGGTTEVVASAPGDA